MRPDGHAIRGWIVPMILVLSAWTGSASADTCRFQTEASAASEGGRFTLKARIDAKSGIWKATLSDAKTRKVVGGTLERLSFHAHFRAFVSRGGSRIVVFAPSAGLGTKDRVLVYDRNLRLLKSFSLDELLTPQELGRVTFSVSHIHNVCEIDRERKAEAWLEDGIFSFHAAGGRTVRIELAEPKVLDPPAARDKK